MKKVITLLILLNLSTFVKSQDSLNFIYLDSVLQVYRAAQLDADFENFEDLNKLTWLLFLPDIGYNFVTGTPYFAYNSNSLFTYFNSKLKQKHAKKTLLKQSVLDLEADQIKLNRLYIQFQKLLEDLKFENEDYTIYSKLYAIKLEKYNKDELSLENLLTAQIHLNSKKQSLFNSENRIYDLILQIELLTHSPINFAMQKE